MTDFIGYLLTFAGLAGIAVGTRLALAGTPSGGIFIVAGLAAAIFAYFFMRSRMTARDGERRAPPARDER